MSLKKVIRPPEDSPPPELRQKEELPVKIPPSVLYNSNLKQMSGFKTLRSSMKRDAFLKEFIKQGLSVFALYEVNVETEYDAEIVSFMCQTAEDSFIHYKKQGVEKRKAVVEVCKKYFDDNEVLVGKIVEQVLPLITKSSLFRRCRARLYNIGMVFLGLCFSK